MVILDELHIRQDVGRKSMSACMNTTATQSSVILQIYEHDLSRYFSWSFSILMQLRPGTKSKKHLELQIINKVTALF